MTQAKISRQSFFFDLFLHLILVHYLLEVSQAFGSVVKDLMLFDPFTYNFIEDDLEADWDATALKVGVVVFSDLLYFGVLLLMAFLDTWFLHHFLIKIITNYSTIKYSHQSFLVFVWPSTSVESLAFHHAQFLHIRKYFLIPETFLHLLTQNV